METTEHSKHLTSRRSLLKGAAIGAGTIGAGRLLADASPALARKGRKAHKADHEKAGSRDAAILQFLAAAEILETDLWQQYNELAGIQDSEVPGGSGNPAYTEAVAVLDEDMDQYIHDNTDDEFSHFTFINAYLEAHGAQTVNLDKFRTLPSSKATGAQQIGRLTNLMQLSVDTSFWTRYRSDSQNPDLGDTLPQAVPGLAAGQFPAIPRSDADLSPGEPPASDRQHGRLPLRLHRGRAVPASTPRSPSGSASQEVLRILLSIGGSEIDALPDLARQGRQRASAHRPHERSDLPRPQRRW